MLRGLRGVNLVGADVVEVSPPFDPSGSTAFAAANLAFEILCPERNSSQRGVKWLQVYFWEKSRFRPLPLAATFISSRTLDVR